MNAKIAICASGEGSNFEAIVRASRSGALQAEVVGLISNRASSGALRRAQALGVPSAILAAKDFPSRSLWDHAMLGQLKAWNADWVALAGYLALVGPEVVRAFSKRIVNTHPALLPKFGGEGMYGLRVHEAVLKAGERETGITVHLVDEEYDRGLILEQVKVDVLPSDRPETLAERIKALENQVYPRILNDLVTGRLTTG